jgi:large subunit ribosomal protein L24
MASHIKKGDMVQIITGDSKGKKGKIMKMIKAKDRVVVEGLNLAFRHVRPSQKNPQGGRIRVEQPIHISNVLPVSTKTDKGTRVRYTVDAKGVKKRVAVDGSEIGVVSKSKKKK